MLAQHIAENSSRGRAEATYREAMAKNQGLRFRAADANLPQQVLRPQERVYEVAVGALRADTFPLLIVTDRRVMHVMDRLRGWTIFREAPVASITGAELQKRLLPGRLRVHVRDGKDISMMVSEQGRTEQVAALLRHLASGGAPPF